MPALAQFGFDRGCFALKCLLNTRFVKVQKRLARLQAVREWLG